MDILPSGPPALVRTDTRSDFVLGQATEPDLSAEEVAEALEEVLAVILRLIDRISAVDFCQKVIAGKKRRVDFLPGTVVPGGLERAFSSVGGAAGGAGGY